MVARYNLRGFELLTLMQLVIVNESERSISPSQDKRRQIGIFALLMGVACWGLTPVILRRLTTFIDAWSANGIRYAISAILYWPLLIVAFRAKRFDYKLVRRCFVPALFALGGQVFWGLAHYEMQASEVGFLVRLSTLWSIIGSMLLFHDERQLLRRPGFYLGALLIMGGFLAMSLLNSAPEVATHSNGLSIEGGSFARGVIYILLCAALFGSYVVSIRSCIPDVDPILAFGIVANLVSVGTLTGMFWMGDPSSVFRLPAYAWLLLAASSALGIAFGHLLMYVAVQRLGASITSACQTLMPFVTAAVASVVLSEKLTREQWMAGIVMIVGAMILLSIKNKISANPHVSAS